jgi:DNA-binding CsgD family transcriptional regulator
MGKKRAMVQLYYCIVITAFGDCVQPFNSGSLKNWNHLKYAIMVSEAVLLRTTERVINYIQQYAQLAGAEKREEVLELFDSMYKLFPHWVLMTCPVMHPDICYVSKNCEPVFGYNNEQLKMNSNPVHFFSFVHEADQEELHSCYSFVHDYLEAIPPENHSAYRTVYYYRFKKPNGEYMYVHDEKAVLHLKDAGSLYYTLFRDITTESAFKGVKAELFKQEHTLRKIKEFKPGTQNNSLSKRESELVHLIRQGLSTKEVAWYLKISHNTVRNIKSKLFEKYRVNNTIELLNITS